MRVSREADSLTFEKAIVAAEEAGSEADAAIAVDSREECVEEGVEVQAEQEAVGNAVGVGTAIWDDVGGFQGLGLRASLSEGKNSSWCHPWEEYLRRLIHPVETIQSCKW
jgi:hypothetical protein